MSPLDLSDELEVALQAALEEAELTADPMTPPSRPDRNAPATAGAVAAPVSTALVAREAAKAPAVLDSEYVATIKAYGPFPALLPASRDFRPLLALSVVGGLLGLDRFHLGKPVSGFLKLATAGGAGIWWIADIIAILNGRTFDKAGHRFSGQGKQLAIAWTLVGVLFAGLATVGVTAAIPPAAAAVNAVREAVFPTPAPVPTWAPLAEGLEQVQSPITLNITGERLRFTYNFPAGAYVYIQKAGDTMVPATVVLLKDKPSQGATELPVTPGSYQLFVRAEGNGWTAKVEELRLNG
ncbi:TM2 domain-containing protein [Paenarthrobacter sp. YJN-5]|uniref:TM2 domain-containing protein n=1 Tax=Paenarthrobacter sp. YJN-5 TaxID=2735316 RepID=UPI001D0CCC08|nr:TM2 domain-containing protein [Paenarthrobacter sp. YJN-5]